MPTLAALHARVGLVAGDRGDLGRAGLLGRPAARARATCVGYRAKPHTGVIDLDRIGHYDPAEFWEEVRTRATAASSSTPAPSTSWSAARRCTIPPDHAAEMAPYLAMVGEFRVHYAGFFDPGFGWAEAGGAGSRGVLEVRCHEAPFVLEHGQVVGRLVYERMAEVPDTLYGAGIASNYQGQGLKLVQAFPRARLTEA